MPADLLALGNGTDVDPIAAATIAHAQFGVIHPFADGNGRIGRVLISWLLTRHFDVLTPPPLSALLAADVCGNTAGLAPHRFGQSSPWVAWSADAVSGAGHAQSRLVAVGGSRRSTTPRTSVVPVAEDSQMALSADPTDVHTGGPVAHLATARGRYRRRPKRRPLSMGPSTRSPTFVTTGSAGSLTDRASIGERAARLGGTAPPARGSPLVRTAVVPSLPDSDDQSQRRELTT